MSNYVRPIISCEDGMAKPLNVFNLAAGVTSIPIMTVPLYYLHRVFTRQSILEVKLYSLSTLLLFCGNLIEHWTGYLGPPCMESLGAASNFVLFSVVYRAWSEQGSKKPHHFPSPVVFSRIMLTAAMVMVFLGPVAGKNAEVLLTPKITPLLGICVVGLLGRVTFQQMETTKKKEGRSASKGWNMFLAAVLCMAATVVLVEVEPQICNLDAIKEPLKRLYHSVLLHTVVPSLFVFLSELSIHITSPPPKLGL